MANIVGLNSTQDDAAGGGRRLRNPTLLDDGSNMRMPGLKPTATPVDTYHRPAQAPIDNNLQSLAEGLSTLNPALQKFMRKEEKSDEEINKDALTVKYGNMRREQFSAALRTDPELQSKVAAQFAGNLQARTLGDADGAEIYQAYHNDFDKQNGNFDQWFDNLAAKRTAERFADNPVGASKYQDSLLGFKNSLRSTYLKDKEEQGDFQRQTLTQDGFKTILRDGVNNDHAPEQIVGEAAEFMRTNKAVMNVGYKKQMEMQLAAVGPLLNDMDKTPEKRDKIYAAVNALFTGTRKGEDGVERRLIDMPDGLGDMAKKKLADFDKKRNELNDKYLVEETAKWKYNATENPQNVNPKELQAWSDAHPGAFKTGEVESLIVSREKALDAAALQADKDRAERLSTQAVADVDSRNLQALRDGNLNLKDAETPTATAFLKGTGETKKYAADAQQQKVVDLYSKDLEFQKNRLVNEKKMTADQADEWARGQEIGTYQLSGIVPSHWKDEMERGANMLTTAAQSASKEMPEGALAGFRRFKTLASQAPNLVSQSTDERTKMIYETAMQAAGNETEQLRGAIQYYANRDAKREQVAAAEVAKAVVKMGKADWVPWVKSYFGGETPENMGALNDEVQQRATYMVQAYHITPKKAVEKATASVKNRYVLVNGWAVDTNDQRLPPTFKSLAENYIRNIAADPAMKEKLGIESEHDLTLFPQRNGTFQLFDKRQFMPILQPLPMTTADGGSRDGRFLTTDYLMELAKQDRDKQEIRAVRAADERLQPLIVIPGTTIGMSRPGSYTPGEMKTIHENIDKAAKPKPQGNREAVEELERNAAADRQRLEKELRVTLPKVEPFIVTGEQRKKDWEARKSVNKKD